MQLLSVSLPADVHFYIYIFFFFNFFFLWKSVWEALSASWDGDLWDNPHWSRQFCQTQRAQSCVSKLSSFSSLDGKRLTWSSQSQSYQCMGLQLPGQFLANKSVQLFHLLRLWVQKSSWDITFIYHFSNFSTISNCLRKKPCGCYTHKAQGWPLTPPFPTTLLQMSCSGFPGCDFLAFVHPVGFKWALPSLRAWSWSFQMPGNSSPEPENIM